MNRERDKNNNELAIPQYRVDYCFPGDENAQRLAILVVVERHSNMKKAIVVPSKGSTGRFAAMQVLDLIRECGDQDSAVVLKTGQEQVLGGRWVHGEDGGQDLGGNGPGGVEGTERRCRKSSTNCRAVPPHGQVAAGREVQGEHRHQGPHTDVSA